MDAKVNEGNLRQIQMQRQVKRGASTAMEHAIEAAEDSVGVQAPLRAVAGTTIVVREGAKAGLELTQEMHTEAVRHKSFVNRMQVPFAPDLTDEDLAVMTLLERELDETIVKLHHTVLDGLQGVAQIAVDAMTRQVEEVTGGGRKRRWYHRGQ